ncbi:hypothetical protein C3397_17735 [Enterobacter cloacae complex sp. ECNIH16]|nr:hypothetical protein C3397_17735 [Enterobacter cloacae complex sp. ECNIH16]PVU55194.1 hypothetical protein CP955_02265 [Enterobacter sp. HN503E2II]
MNKFTSPRTIKFILLTFFRLKLFSNRGASHASLIKSKYLFNYCRFMIKHILIIFYFDPLRTFISYYSTFVECLFAFLRPPFTNTITFILRFIICPLSIHHYKR